METKELERAAREQRLLRGIRPLSGRVLMGQELLNLSTAEMRALRDLKRDCPDNAYLVIRAKRPPVDTARKPDEADPKVTAKKKKSTPRTVSKEPEEQKPPFKLTYDLSPIESGGYGCSVNQGPSRRFDNAKAASAHIGELLSTTSRSKVLAGLELAEVAQ